jgi:hypothetical protein
MFSRVLHLLLSPAPRNRIAGSIAIGLAIIYVFNAWHVDGEVSCDFGSQWLIGRMFFEGRGRELYWAPAGEQVLSHGYAGEGFERLNLQINWKHPEGQPHTGIEGPLYPPTMGLLMAPFAMLEPRAAFVVLALIYVQLAGLSAWLIHEITDGRLQLGEASLFVLAFPYLAMGLTIGQNSAFTLMVVVAGWAVQQRGRPLVAGLIWGLLAYKPVFAVALIGVPAVLGNGRMLLGMLIGGGLFCLATLPFCGFDLLHVDDTGMSLNAAHPWRRWLTVGANAADTYAVDPNWVWMSRDVLNLPRRAMWNIDYTIEHAQSLCQWIPWDLARMQQVDESALATWIGRGLLIALIGLTISVVVWVRMRSGSHPPELQAFTLLGGLLSTYHFIWYDLLPAVLPCALLLSQWQRLGRFGRGWLIVLGVLLALSEAGIAWGRGPITWPVDTLGLLFTWGWAGWATIRSLRHGATSRPS